MSRDHFYLLASYLSGLFAVLAFTADQPILAVISGVLCGYCYRQVRESFREWP